MGHSRYKPCFIMHALCQLNYKNQSIEGSERYQAMSRIYYRGAWAAVVCYDLTEELSFAKAKFWVAELGQNEPNCRLYFCGTKRDLISDINPRQVEFQSALEFAENYGAPVFETSSRTGENVAELFERIARDFVQQLDLRKPLAKDTLTDARLTLEDNLRRKKHNDCHC